MNSKKAHIEQGHPSGNHPLRDWACGFELGRDLEGKVR